MYSIDVCIFEAIYGRFVDEYNGKYVNMFVFQKEWTVPLSLMMSFTFRDRYSNL